MKPEPSIISEDDFEAKFRPKLDSNGDFLTFEDVKNKPLHKVWTILEGDGPWMHLYASPGFHIVNVLGYVLTAVPWKDQSQDAYWYFDDRPAFTATLADGEEVDEVGEDEADARQRIEDGWGVRITSIRKHDEEV